MQIRLAVQGDAIGIARVHVASWQTTYRGIMPDELLDNLSIARREQYWRKVIAEELEQIVLYVAEEHQQIVGFISGGKPQETVAHFDGELYAIYLLEATQGRGLGRQLVKTFAKAMQARGFERIMLWVLADNQDSRGFYEHLGGQVVAIGDYPVRDQTLKKLAIGWSNIEDLLP